MALQGIKVVEFAALAPGPFAGLVLADNGASVTRIDRLYSTSMDVLCRNKRSLTINPKVPSGCEVLRRLIASSDVLIDPFRPGVMERLGLGPNVFLGEEGKPGLNERLVYARIVGFPREGSHKDMAGHDINYLALSGVLSMLPGSSKRPIFPLNLLADFAGGGLTCALGIILALFERNRSGRGQIIDADMVSGVRYVSSFPLIHRADSSSGMFSGDRGTNLLDGGAPFYNVYTCKDGGYISVGCLEPQFFKVFIEKFVNSLPEEYKDLHGWTPDASTQSAHDEWPRLKDYLERGFVTRTRDEWGRIFYGTEACCVPILTPEEASELSFLKLPIPLPHPKVVSFGNSSSHITSHDYHLSPGKHTDEILRELGLTDEEYRTLVKEEAIEVAKSKL